MLIPASKINKASFIHSLLTKMHITSESSLIYPVRTVSCPLKNIKLVCSREPKLHDRQNQHTNTRIHSLSSKVFTYFQNSYSNAVDIQK